MNAKLLIATAHLAPCELSLTMVILRWEFFLLCFMKISNSNSKSNLQISFAFEKCFYRIGLGFYFLLPCLSWNNKVLKFPRSVSAVKPFVCLSFLQRLSLSLIASHWPILKAEQKVHSWFVPVWCLHLPPCAQIQDSKLGAAKRSLDLGKWRYHLVKQHLWWRRGLHVQPCWCSPCLGDEKPQLDEDLGQQLDP